MALIESVPNVSEGRRAEVVDALAAALRGVAGVRLLDYSADASHNRSVFTLAGEADALRTATLALFQVAIETIDLRSHTGEHPRLGAVDVVPFIPIEGATMSDCVALARETAAQIAARFDLPVFLYEAAATHPSRANLADIRRGQFEGLGDKMLQAEWTPDFGPAVPHPTAGATVVGARMPLIAFNVNLATDRLDIARTIAAAVRFSSGGLPHVKAMGIPIAERGIVQVSMNLTNHEETPIHRAFEAVAQEAARHGVRVLESEIIGLVPAAALTGRPPHAFLLRGFSPNQVLETRLRQE